MVKTLRICIVPLRKTTFLHFCGYKESQTYWTDNNKPFSPSFLFLIMHMLFISVASSSAAWSKCLNSLLGPQDVVMPQRSKVLNELKEKFKILLAASRYLDRSPVALVLCLATESGDQHNLFICNKCDTQGLLLEGQHRGRNARLIG